MGKWLVRLVGATVITVTLAALCQELEKPRAERRWHGKLGVIPYDFRAPTAARLMEIFWNAEDGRIFTGAFWGIGWGINLYTLLEKMRIVGTMYITEDDFLMPTRTLRKILENRPVMP
ncbi:MAG: hypothetical protein WC370_07560 [Dehalococcoidales bacterium]|jgi:hypothetical protein